MTITLEAIKAAHTKVAEMIAAFEKQPAPQALPINVPLPMLAEGEKFVGVISADGAKRHDIILLPGKIEGATWQKAVDWAASIGGELPDRFESALLFATIKDEFKPEWHWTREQHAADASYAWGQDFFNGYQDGLSKYYEGRARAVRRVELK